MYLVYINKKRRGFRGFRKDPRTRNFWKGLEQKSVMKVKCEWKE